MIIFLISLFLSGTVFGTPPDPPDTTWCFLVAGHAYGAHLGENTGLHPPFLESLARDKDERVSFIVLTGDIVNQSTSLSWQQVHDELSGTGLESFYVMGNHDNNETGRQVFIQKHGGLYYAFQRGGILFIVLNSTEQDRSVSPVQMEFLQKTLSEAPESIKEVFIFFHELLWNSDERYSFLRSNTRSRYTEMVRYSNYLTELRPLLNQYPGMHFYLVAGDVGGNPDAVAAFYDTTSNLSLCASGMGEVPEENYMKVCVLNSTVSEIQFIALNASLELKEKEYYNIPAAPAYIEGPSGLMPNVNGISYTAGEVFNAGTYEWQLPAGMTGSGSKRSIMVSTGPDFAGGVLSVKAVHDGYGKSPAASMEIKSLASGIGNLREFPGRIMVYENSVIITGINLPAGRACMSICDLNGKLLGSKTLFLTGRETEVCLALPEGSFRGPVIVCLRTDALKWNSLLVYPAGY